jgi:hypothetical protein
MSPVFKAFQGGEELRVMNVIVAFRRREGTGVKRKRMQRTVLVRLTAHSSESVLGGVRFYSAYGK